MEVARKDKGDTAIMVIESDEKINEQLVNDLQKLDNVISVIRMVD